MAAANRLKIPMSDVCWGREKSSLRGVISGRLPEEALFLRAGSVGGMSVVRTASSPYLNIGIGRLLFYIARKGLIRVEK